MQSMTSSLQGQLQTVQEAVSRGNLKGTTVSQFLADHPLDFQSLVLRGHILEQLSRPQEALSAYQRAAKLMPEHAFPFTRTAILQFREQFGLPAPAQKPSDRAAISMSSLGANGRFGNQILQYAYLRLYADENGLSAQTPDWIGRDLYDLDDPYPTPGFPRIDERDFDFMAALSGQSGKKLSGTDISGYFCGPTRLWGKRQEQFRALFRPGRRMAPVIERAMAAVFERGKTLVALHLRRGDFGSGRFWIAPERWYLDWLNAIWAKLDSPVLYIATYDPGTLDTFSSFSPLSAASLDTEIRSVAFFVDHQILSRAHHLATSNSSFSISAAMLNGHSVSTMRPDPAKKRLVPFDPWDTDIFFDAADNGELAAEDRAIIKNVVRPSGVAVYVGDACSQWATVTRQTHPYLKVRETADPTIDQFRTARDIRHITDLVVEDESMLTAVLAGSERSIGHARIDAIHFKIQDSGFDPANMKDLVARGFCLFRFEDQQLKRVQPDESPQRGLHFALQERLLPLFLGQRLSGLDIPALCTQHGILTPRVLHVGAHEGQEIATYDAIKAERVLFIEANPAVYDRLDKAMRGRPHVTCVNRAICDRSGPVVLNVASFDQSSSIYAFSRVRDVYPQITHQGSIEVAGSTLDDLIQELNLPFETFDFLHMDVQGAEAAVLRGAVKVLPSIRAISVEVNFEELYEGCAQIEDIDDLLIPLGFRRVAMLCTFHPTWGDAFYVRSEPSQNCR